MGGWEVSFGLQDEIVEPVSLNHNGNPLVICIRRPVGLIYQSMGSLTISWNLAI
jgi:hypothetical protein